MRALAYRFYFALLDSKLSLWIGVDRFLCLGFMILKIFIDAFLSLTEELAFLLVIIIYFDERNEFWTELRFEFVGSITSSTDILSKNKRQICPQQGRLHLPLNFGDSLF